MYFCDSFYLFDENIDNNVLSLAMEKENKSKPWFEHKNGCLKSSNNPEQHMLSGDRAPASNGDSFAYLSTESSERLLFYLPTVPKCTFFFRNLSLS